MDISKIVVLVKNNKVIVENYFFMTILQILNSLFYLLIYPYLLNALGLENYGLYVFFMGIITYFVSFVSFGFDFPAVKEISQHPDDSIIKNKIISVVFTAKIYLELISIIIFVSLIFLIPILKEYWIIISILFINTVVNIIFPIWYFQGIQKMKIVTYIQLLFKVVSLPFIFIFISSPNDLVQFVLIITLSNLFGGIIAFWILIHKEKVKIEWVPFKELLKWYKDALPFFWSSAGAMIKQQGITIIIGAYFNMRDVALYDLAYKIISIPLILFSSINGALFPKIAKDNRKNIIKKVLFFEFLAGAFAIAGVIIFGKLIILLVGGVAMEDSYGIAVILSFGIFTFLLVGAYINFIFVPQSKYYLVTQNQIVSLLVFIILLSIGLYFWMSIISIALAWTLAGLFEILYCNILIKKHKLF